MRSLSDADIRTILETLGRHTSVVTAARELARTLQRPVSPYTLCHALQRRQLGSPASYLAPPLPSDPVRQGGRVDYVAGMGDAGRGVRVTPAFAGREPVAEAGTNSRHLQTSAGDLSHAGKAGDSDNPRTDPTLHATSAPRGYHLRGVSTMLDANGKPVAQWVKTTQDRDADNLERLLDALKELPETYSQAHEPVKPPEHTMADMLAVYPVGDPHLGMFAWCEETGANYDVRIAERLHVQAIKHLVAGAPPAKQALVISLGDFFHVNNDLARTERNGNPLDTDSRFSKVLRVGVGMFTAMIDAALEKHDRVRVICEVGNHDAQASMMLALAMDTFYARDERVSVDTSPARFHYHRFGKCLFGTTHGDGAKADKLPQIMAHDRAPDWGQTTYRKWFVGHVHTDRLLCFPGCRVEHYRTLAGRDAWAHGEGYRSDRGMGVEYYHREHGYVGNGYVPLSLLEAA